MTTTQLCTDAALLLGLAGVMVSWGMEANRASNIRRYGRHQYEQMRNMRLRFSWDGGPQQPEPERSRLGPLDIGGDQASGSAAQRFGCGNGGEDTEWQAAAGGLGQVWGKDRSQSPIRQGTAWVPQQVEDAVDQSELEFKLGLESTGVVDSPIYPACFYHYFSPDFDNKTCAICGSGPGGTWHFNR